MGEGGDGCRRGWVREGSRLLLLLLLLLLRRSWGLPSRQVGSLMARSLALKAAIGLEEKERWDGG